MKKFTLILLTAGIILTLAGCGKTKKVEDVDVDLTTMSSTMVYSYVYDMLSHPDNYKGQMVRMDGDSNTTHGGTHSCIVYDALGCCTEGIEYVLPEEQEYPDDGTKITVVGKFATYKKGEGTYFVLVDSVLE
ncbi:hypothetical protein SAMN04487830_1335 [Pseudobutyrivibrio sp. OR37]|uniref:hypothetical protein n=1 Tax=Pseudobutyrivibrio sp. OR37 TaxID=1798186 RepID=UPI0008EE36B0|nr:hypothetical protein [Pseudobutyrivibrio sp. OR37]SFI23851.1 hypothetical protein SAMN04487830_1335 [Pseudobutyrivibrio sp. OR37]